MDEPTNPTTRNPVPAMIEARDLFDLPAGVSYLKACSATPLMHSAREAGLVGVAKKSRPWTIGADDTFGAGERARTLFARLIGAEADDVALCPSASYGLSTAARNLPVGEDRDVVILEGQFPSNVYPWTDAIGRTGGKLVTVPYPDDGDWTAGTLAAISDKTAVAALPAVHWTDASRVDLVAVGKRCRETRTALVLDLSQSLGAVPFDVRAVKPDFMVAVTEKWLLGPYQLAFLYVAPKHQRGIPIEFGWMNRERAEDYDTLVDYRERYQPGARRFDMGEKGNYVTLPMAIEALARIIEWTPAAIEDHIAPLIDMTAEQAVRLGLIPTPAPGRSRHMIGLRRPGGLPAELPQRLAAHDVHVTMRGGCLRIAPHVYNTHADIERLIEALAAEL